MEGIYGMGLIKSLYFACTDLIYNIFYKNAEHCNFCGKKLKINTYSSLGVYQRAYYCPDRHRIDFYNLYPCKSKLDRTEYHLGNYLCLHYENDNVLSIYSSIYRHLKPISYYSPQIKIPYFNLDKLTLDQAERKLATYVLFS